MPDSLERKLAVILHADVVGSTRLVQRSEALAHQGIVAVFKGFAAIIKAHGGSIQVDSVPDRGTTFCIRLPLTNN